MRVIFHSALLILYIATSNSSIYSDVKDKVSSILSNSVRSVQEIIRNNDESAKHRGSRFEVKGNNADANDVLQHNALINIIRIFKARDSETNPNQVKKTNSLNNVLASKDRTKGEKYHIDPVLNSIRKSRDFRRTLSDEGPPSTSDSSSSSMEMKNWKQEWKEHWMKKKLEAINSSHARGDSINMLAARPWGVQCGDPNQHDMPWGSCMLPMECEAEYRIYRGDFLCGRTQFVCCALQLTNYDLYQGFDVSFADSDMTTDSEEKRNKGKGSSEKKRRKKLREKQKRKTARLKRKKQIKKKIRKIIKEIRKILSRQYRNGTKQRNQKTKQLKQFIKDLKKKFRQDRNAVKDIHELELVKIDATLLAKLDQIQKMNDNFIKNSTFRDIVVNGTITKQGARMLMQAYPELVTYFTTRRSNNEKNEDEPKDYLDYDVEYGMLYY